MSISHIDRFDEKTLVWISTHSCTMGKYNFETRKMRVLLENLNRPVSVRVRESSVYVLEEGEKGEGEGRLIKYDMNSGYVCIMITQLFNARGLYVSENHDVIFSQSRDETRLPEASEKCSISSIQCISDVLKRVFCFAYGTRENDETIRKRYFGDAAYASTYRALYYERPEFPTFQACAILSRRFVKHNEQNTFRRRICNKARVRILRLSGRYVKRCKPHGVNLSLQSKVETLLEREMFVVRDVEKPFRPLRDLFVLDNVLFVSFHDNIKAYSINNNMSKIELPSSFKGLSNPNRVHVSGAKIFSCNDKNLVVKSLIQSSCKVIVSFSHNVQSSFSVSAVRYDRDHVVRQRRRRKRGPENDDDEKFYIIFVALQERRDLVRIAIRVSSSTITVLSPEEAKHIFPASKTEDDDMKLGLTSVLGLVKQHQSEKEHSNQDSETSSQKKKVQVVVRCRPLLDHECSRGDRAAIRAKTGSRKVMVLSDVAGTRRKLFHFDRVFGSETKQKDFYNKAFASSVMHVLDGHNCTIIAYVLFCFFLALCNEFVFWIGFHVTLTHTTQSHTLERIYTQTHTHTYTDMGRLGQVRHFRWKVKTVKLSTARKRVFYLELYIQCLVFLKVQMSRFVLKCLISRCTCSFLFSLSLLFNLTHHHLNNHLNRYRETIRDLLSPPNLTAEGKQKAFSSVSVKKEGADEDNFLHRDQESYAKSVTRIRELVSKMNNTTTSTTPKRLHVVCRGDASKLEGGNIRVDIPGLTKVHVKSPDEVFEVLRCTALLRRSAPTKMNSRSSRSHSVLTLNVTQGNHRTGRLRVVDLSGTEDIKQSGSVGMRAKEAMSINQGLLAIGRVIKAVAARKPFVPYRDSILTRLLRDSFGGTAISTLLLTVSPREEDLKSTMSTLEYVSLCILKITYLLILLSFTLLNYTPSTYSLHRYARSARHVHQDEDQEKNNENDNVVKVENSMMEMEEIEEEEEEEEKEEEKNVKIENPHHKRWKLPSRPPLHRVPWKSSIPLRDNRGVRHRFVPPGTSLLLHAQALEWCKQEFLSSGNVLSERARDALTEIFTRFDVKKCGELSNEHIKELSMVLNTTGQLMTRQDEEDLGRRVVLRLERFLDFFCSRVKADPVGVQNFLERMGYTMGLVRKEGTFFRAREGKKGLPFQVRRERRHAIASGTNRVKRHLKESVRDKQARDPAMNIWKWVEVRRNNFSLRRPKTASAALGRGISTRNLIDDSAKASVVSFRPISSDGRRHDGKRCPPT
jgi:hypothetical protein